MLSITFYVNNIIDRGESFNNNNRKKIMVSPVKLKKQTCAFLIYNVKTIRECVEYVSCNTFYTYIHGINNLSWKQKANTIDLVLPIFRRITVSFFFDVAPCTSKDFGKE